MLNQQGIPSKLIYLMERYCIGQRARPAPGFRLISTPDDPIVSTKLVCFPPGDPSRFQLSSVVPFIQVSEPDRP